MGNEQSVSTCSAGCFARGPADTSNGGPRGPAQVLGPHHKSLLRGLPKPRMSRLDDRSDGPPVTVQIVSDIHLEFLQTVFELPSFDGNRSAGSLGEISHSWQHKSNTEATTTSTSSSRPSSSSSSSSSSSDDDANTRIDDDLSAGSSQKPRSLQSANSFSFLFSSKQPNQPAERTNDRPVPASTSTTATEMPTSSGKKQRPTNRRRRRRSRGGAADAIADLKLHFGPQGQQDTHAEQEDLSLEGNDDAQLDLDCSAIAAASSSSSASDVSTGGNVTAIDPENDDNNDDDDDDDDDGSDGDSGGSYDDELSDEVLSSSFETSSASASASTFSADQSSYLSFADSTQMTINSEADGFRTANKTTDKTTGRQQHHHHHHHRTHIDDSANDEDDDEDESSTMSLIDSHQGQQQQQQQQQRLQQGGHQSIIESAIPHFNFQAAESTFRQFVQTTPVRSSFLALLGDIGNPEFEAYAYFLRWCASQYERVFVVAGDHEGFGLDRPWSVTLKMISNACADAGDNVIFCYKTAIEMDNFRILATTLWTDVNVGNDDDDNDDNDQNQTMMSMKKKDNDDGDDETTGEEHRHRRRKSGGKKKTTTSKKEGKEVEEVEKLMGALSIGVIDSSTGEGRKATARDTRQWHREEVEWLRKELRENPNTPTLVLTHHAPLMCCLEPGMMPGDAQAQFYCSQLADLFTEPVVAWAYGHTHFPLDCRVGPVRLVSNPAGFPQQEFPRPGGRSFQANFVLDF